MIFFRQVSQQFGVAMSTAHDTVREVVAAIIAKMGEIITLPSDMQAIKAVADGFGVFGFPNVYGAIDGSSIKVIVPASVKGNYYTRKHITAINLTAMCDSKKRFLDINCGNSERCHDAHIFQTSELGRKVLAEKIIPEQYHIIGDAAYGLHTNILTPYKSEENAIQKRYNHLHSSTRMAVERVFGDLKNRWRCLSGLECSVDFSKEIVAVCCILHNICIENNDIQPTDKLIIPGSGNVVIQDCSTGKAKRDSLATML